MPRVKATPRKRPCPPLKEDTGSLPSQEELGSLLKDALKESYGCLARLKQESLLGMNTGNWSWPFDEKSLEDQFAESSEKLATLSYQGPRLPMLMSARSTRMLKEAGKLFD